MHAMCGPFHYLVYRKEHTQLLHMHTACRTSPPAQVDAWCRRASDTDMRACCVMLRTSIEYHAYACVLLSPKHGFFSGGCLLCGRKLMILTTPTACQLIVAQQLLVTLSSTWHAKRSRLPPIVQTRMQPAAITCLLMLTCHKRLTDCLLLQ